MVKKHNRELKPKRQLASSTVVIALIVVIAVVVLSLYFGSQPQESTPETDYSVYNTFAFEQLEIGWQTHVQRNGQVYEAPFYFHPLEIENVSFDTNVSRHLLQVINTISPPRQIVIAIEPEAGSVPVLAGVNIAKITGRFYERETISALYLERNETDLYEDQRFVNCDAGNIQNTIIKISANETRNSVEFLDDYCILVGGVDRDGVLMAADLLGYKLLGIMQ